MSGLADDFERFDRWNSQGVRVHGNADVVVTAADSTSVVRLELVGIRGDGTERDDQVRRWYALWSW
jgi:hypothetical protein